MSTPRPVPLWFALGCGFVAVWALGYLLFYTGGFQADVYEEEGPAPAEAGAPIDGKKTYFQNCAICHQPDGQGLPGHYPPLAGSPVVLGKEGFGTRHLVRVVLGGLVEPITIEGHTYDATMTPWGAVLNDAQVAAVLTYARQAWGNQAPPVTMEEVAAIRAASAGREKPWTVTELKKVP